MGGFFEESGAGEGNRTLVLSLGSFCSTIELHPQGGALRAPELHCTQRLSTVKQHLMERLPCLVPCGPLYLPKPLITLSKQGTSCRTGVELCQQHVAARITHPEASGALREGSVDGIAT